MKNKNKNIKLFIGGVQFVLIRLICFSNNTIFVILSLPNLRWFT